MKTIVLSIAALLTLGTAKAQFTQNFEGTEASLTGNCWTLSNVYRTTDPAEVITGTGSMYTNPPTTESGTRDLITPALDIKSSDFQVAFNYKLSSPLNGNATRTIEIGLLDVNGVYSVLQTIAMDKFTPATVLNFNHTFLFTPIGVKRLVLKLGGNTGDGNSRLILDDLYSNANAKYGTGTCNSAPVAVNDFYNGISGTVISGNVTSNDSEPDGETMSAAIVATPANGVLVLNANGSFSFTPNTPFTGQTTFTYRLNDNGYAPLNSNVATVTLTYVAPVTLPVSLVSFNAMLNENNKVNLSWTTAMELNVSHFVVEKSTDGNNYSDAGIVFAVGNSSEKVNYAFIDNLGNTQAKIIYYRLRSVDVDGKEQISETRVIRLSKTAGPAISILAFPNPVTTDLRITIPANWQNKKVVYEVYGLNGALAVKKENNNSSQTESINISKAAPGVYMVRVICEGETAQQKIIKQ